MTISSPTTPGQQLHAKRTAQAIDQLRVNQMLERAGAEAARTLALELAEAEHAQYPQYAGHWDGWTLGRATSKITSKGGTQAEPGDIVLFKLDRPGLSCTPSHTFYSARLGWDCSASWGIEPLEGWAAAYRMEAGGR